MYSLCPWWARSLDLFDESAEDEPEEEEEEDEEEDEEEEDIAARCCSVSSAGARVSFVEVARWSK